MFLIKVLTINKTPLSKLDIGSSITKILSLVMFVDSIEPLARCIKYKNVMKCY